MTEDEYRTWSQLAVDGYAKDGRGAVIVPMPNTGPVYRKNGLPQFYRLVQTYDPMRQFVLAREQSAQAKHLIGGRVFQGGDMSASINELHPDLLPPPGSSGQQAAEETGPDLG